MKYFLMLLLLLQVSIAFSQVEFNSQKQQWTLRSGDNSYLLSNGTKTITQSFQRRGETAQPGTGAKTAVSDNNFLSFSVAGQQVTAADFILSKHSIMKQRDGVDILTLELAGKKVPLTVIVACKAFSSTGVFTRSITLKNTSQAFLDISNIASISVSLPEGKYDLQYLSTVWGKERQLRTEPLASDSLRLFVVNKGRSGEDYSSWFSLLNKSTENRYMAQLAYSGNWQMSFHQAKTNGPVEVKMGMRIDGGVMSLAPSATFETPEVAFTLGSNDIDDAANNLHAYQREFIIPRVSTNEPLLVEYNSWFSVPNKVYVNELKKQADGAAALGCEAFVLDAGWYNEALTDWSSELGNWYPTKTSFPNGLEELADYVRNKNMLFGLWIEIESAGKDSKVAKEHPEWMFSFQDKPLLRGSRYHLNFANDSARAWALATISRLVKTYDLKWIKMDYNNAVGQNFDKKFNGLAIYEHTKGLFRLLDTVHQLFPELIVENCASGGMRTDLAIMKHTNTAWLSDITYPRQAPQLVWGGTLEFVPDISNYWMTGDTTIKDVWFCKEVPEHPEWWNYMFRIAMNGQFGISSRTDLWPASLVDAAKQNVMLYKRIRHVILGADVFHLTAMPDYEKPMGSMSIQYQNKNKNLVLAYRLQNGNAQEVIKLKNLQAGRKYSVAVNGIKQSEKTGNELMTKGVDVALAYDFSSAVIEVNE